jgi:hypothetical protein
VRQRRRRFASILFVLMICVVGTVGFVRGWFRLNTSEDSARNEVHIDLTLDRGRFQSDAESAAEKTREEVSRLSDSIHRGTSDWNRGSRGGSSATPL